MRARASMADVGRLAGVSAQTVSRYFTGTSYVSADARERIEAAVAALNFRPNLVARNLRANHTRTIGVMAIGELNYGMATLLAGLSAAARATDYSLAIAQIEAAPSDPGAMAEAQRALDNLQSFQVDGILLATSDQDSEALFERIWETLPVLTISGRTQLSVDSATVDSHQAGYLATRHLIELGHTRILHVGGPPRLNETYERVRGYEDALREADLAPLDIVGGSGWSAEAGFAAGLAADPDAFTGVFAGNDQIALGFLRAMRTRGYAAPLDYSIIGVDDMPDAAFFEPPLSSIYMDFHTLGTESFDMIRHHIETGERLERRVLPAVLVPRESTAPPPTR